LNASSSSAWERNMDWTIWNLALSTLVYCFQGISLWNHFIVLVVGSGMRPMVFKKSLSRNYIRWIMGCYQYHFRRTQFWKGDVFQHLLMWILTCLMEANNSPGLILLCLVPCRNMPLMYQGNIWPSIQESNKHFYMVYVARFLKRGR